jgi:hypothetical protein
MNKECTVGLPCEYRDVFTLPCTGCRSPHYCVFQKAFPNIFEGNNNTYTKVCTCPNPNTINTAGLCLQCGLPRATPTF